MYRWTQQDWKSGKKKKRRMHNKKWMIQGGRAMWTVKGKWKPGQNCDFAPE